MNFLYVYEEYTDITGVHGSKGDVIGQLAQEVWKRLLSFTAPGSPCIHRFIDDIYSSMKALVVNNEDSVVQSNEFPLNLPDEVIFHPAVVSLNDIANDIIGLVNDMHSYRVEHARDLRVHNAITVIMAERNMDIQDAFNWLGNYINQLASQFCTEMKLLPTWGESIDGQLSIYIDQIGQWVRGNDDWSRESRRYYPHSDELNDINRSSFVAVVLSYERGLADEEVKRMVMKQIGLQSCDIT
ncbi:isoprenoid synthase domain-containing protein [Cyathus striatus]|nr:isoprenoid synthase domain-containing protein [Cyathus striatus]